MPKEIPYTDEQVVIIDGVKFAYDAYYKRLYRVKGDDDEKTPYPIEVICPCCHGACFTIGYGNYECIATCSCGHSMVVYDG